MLLSILLFAFPAAMVYAALSDLRTLTIPNAVSVILILTFAVLAPFAGLPLKDIGLHVAAGALILAVGFGLFACGFLGGGDAKLLAAGSLWVGFDHLLPFIFNVTLFGAVLIFAIIAFRRFVSEEAVASANIAWASRLRTPGSGVPYGIAIASSALLVFPKTALFALVLG